MSGSSCSSACVVAPGGDPDVVDGHAVEALAVLADRVEPTGADRLADRMHRRHRRLDVEVGAGHGCAVVDRRAVGSSQVDALDHADDSTSGRLSCRDPRQWLDYVGGVSDTLPMFPLNAVLFPGVSVPLTVFEDRYRALVHHLLRVVRPGGAAVRLGRDPRGLRGRRPRRPVAVPGRLPDAADRDRGDTRTAPSRSSRSAWSGSSWTGWRPAGCSRSATSPSAPTPRRTVPGVGPRAGPDRVHGVPGRAGRHPQRPVRRARSPATRRTSPGRWPRSRRCRCPSGSRCSRPRTPPSG